MRKLISLLLALVMVMSFATVAFADNYDANGGVVTYPEEDGYTDIVKVTINKKYTQSGVTAVSPAETFHFTITNGWEGTYVENPGVGVTNDNTIPAVTIATEPAFAEGAAANSTVVDLVLTLPTYTNVGKYYYTITETASTTAGVVSHSTPIKLVVTVIQQGDDQIRVAAVHTETDGAKSDEIENTYTAGSLKVEKTVAGVLGDQEKPFEFTVTFTPDDDENIDFAFNEIQNATTGTYKSLEKDDETGVWTYTFELKHGESITFTNIPQNTAYEVTETAYSDYETTYDENKSGEIVASAVSTTITNTKDGDIDTGIELDSVPFVVMMIVGAAAAVLFVIKRRSVEF